MQICVTIFHAKISEYMHLRNISHVESRLLVTALGYFTNKTIDHDVFSKKNITTLHFISISSQNVLSPINAVARAGL